jgi:hypothetical protein
LTQAPVAVLHESVVHASLSSQSTAVPLHVPPAHTSFVVHAFASSHAFVLFANWHVPLTQVSVVQTLLSLQSALVAHTGTQTSLTHASPAAQSSSFAHSTHSSLASRQTCPAAQGAVPSWQAPSTQVSAPSQNRPLSHPASSVHGHTNPRHAAVTAKPTQSNPPRDAQRRVV